jgi:hypothetical protein
MDTDENAVSYSENAMPDADQVSPALEEEPMVLCLMPLLERILLKLLPLVLMKWKREKASAIGISPTPRGSNMDNQHVFLLQYPLF